jgi:hypothetical protein
VSAAFWSRVGADGRRHVETADYETALESARELSTRGPIWQGQMFSERSGLIAEYHGGEMTGYLDGGGRWVTT